VYDSPKTKVALAIGVKIVLNTINEHKQAQTDAFRDSRSRPRKYRITPTNGKNFQRKDSSY